jgi:hypothetical protein
VDHWTCVYAVVCSLTGPSCTPCADDMAELTPADASFATNRSSVMPNDVFRPNIFLLNSNAVLRWDKYAPGPGSCALCG